mmetsp:Transcript_23453/g.54174  ORF Transcript_23453/g.54174 Transcript_23453/m.54174 type:complete len:233 (-) Transcript_23453:165-863(-)
MAHVLSAQPDVNCLRGKAPIAGREDHSTSWFQHATHFLHNLQWLVQVVHGNCTGHYVKGCILVRQCGVHIQVTQRIVISLPIGFKLCVIHAGNGDMRPTLLLRVVTDPTRANIKDPGVFVVFEDLLIELCQSLDKIVIHMGAEARCRIEDCVIHLILPSKIVWCVRPLCWPLDFLKQFLSITTCNEVVGPTTKCWSGCSGRSALRAALDLLVSTNCGSRRQTTQKESRAASI